MQEEDMVSLRVPCKLRRPVDLAFALDMCAAPHLTFLCSVCVIVFLAQSRCISDSSDAWESGHFTGVW